MSNNPEKSFAVVCLGCKVNRAETDAFSASLLSNGYRYTSPENANLIIVNTCTVTHVADKKTRQSVRKVIAANTMPSTRIIVTGCAAVIHPDVFLQMDSRIEVVHKVEVMSTIGISSDFDNNVLKQDNFRNRASIKIQDGCNNNCSFCIVHTARGKSTSLNPDSIIRTFRQFIDAGISEIVLSGVNLGAYNYQGKNLSSLLRDLLDVIDAKYSHKSIGARIRLSSIEPQNIDDELISLIKNSNGRICRHLHLPLQSGSSKILKEMNRHYDRDGYKTLIDKLRSEIPSVSISTDIIVGFPGEMAEDFQQTYELSQYCEFVKIHVFPYSKREGTPAAIRTDQIDENVKNERAKILRDLSDNLAKKDAESRKGIEEYALCESSGMATTESYHSVKIDNVNPNELIKFTW